MSTYRISDFKSSDYDATMHLPRLLFVKHTRILNLIYEYSTN